MYYALIITLHNSHLFRNIHGDSKFLVQTKSRTFCSSIWNENQAQKFAPFDSTNITYLGQFTYIIFFN